MKEEGRIVKSPLNFTGGKHKLLPQLLPLFPDDIHTFVDLFCGGCNVAANVSAGKIVCNDNDGHLIGLLRYFQNKPKTEIVGSVLAVIEKARQIDGFTQTYMR